MVVPGAARPAPRSGPQREGTGSNDGTSGPHPPSPMSHATLSRRSTTPAALTSHCPCPEYTSHTRRPRSCPGRRMPGAARPGPRSGPQRTALERGCVQLVPRAQSCAAPAVAATTARAALTRHHRRPMRSLRDAQRHQQPSQDIAHVLKHLTHRQPAAPGRCAPGPAQRAAREGTGSNDGTSGPHTPSPMSHAELSGLSTTPAALTSHCPCPEYTSHTRRPRSCPGRRMPGAARPAPHSGPQRTALERGCIRLVPGLVAASAGEARRGRRGRRWQAVASSPSRPNPTITLAPDGYTAGQRAPCRGACRVSRYVSVADWVHSLRV
jgi:hypothetical protein